MTDQPLEPHETPSPGRTETPPTESERPPDEPSREPAPTTPTPRRRLERSRDDRVIAGVCGGLGKYLGVDSVLIRIAAVVLIFAGGAGLLLYAIGWLVIPEEPEEGARATAAPTGPAPAAERTSSAVVLGFLFVALGAFFLADAIWPDFFSWRYVWPIALILVGAAVLFRARR